MILTVTEIRDLAEAVGLVLTDESYTAHSDDDTEVLVEECPSEGVWDPNTEKRHHYAHVVSFLEYTEDGVSGLGPELPPEEKQS